ncbi:hypothetical protein ON010_g3081 [Phytophthora cinnamomi]|nr:hypothetical protein ON010_g3081 [Phytophthora cinnamomi]
MSLFEITTDDAVTVAEALAFIDSFDTNHGDGEHQSINHKREAAQTSQSATNSTSSSSADTTDSAPKIPQRRKKTSNPPGYTTRIQRRKRAELQNLRDEAQALEAQLNLLETTASNAISEQVMVTGESLAARSKWIKLLEIERNRRRHSEETNRKLRAIFAHFLEVNRSLRRTFEKKTLLEVGAHFSRGQNLVLNNHLGCELVQGINFVFGNEPTPTHSFTAFENSKAIAGHLEQLVGELYLRSGSVFESWSSSAISYSLRFKFDQKRGKVAEMKATTPVGCPMEAAADLTWQEQSGQLPDPQKWTRRMRGRLPNSQEKNWVLTLQCQSYVKQLTGIQFLQKFEEPNRILLVRTDLITLTGQGFQFRDQTWTTITRSEEDPRHASVVRIFEEVFMECQEGFSARPDDIAYAQNVVLKNLSWKLQDCTKRLQDTLMEHVELS